MHPENTQSLSQTYEALEAWLAPQTAHLRAKKPALCVGVLPDGVLSTALAANALATPVAFMRYDPRMRDARWDSSQPPPAPGSVVFLCEGVQPDPAALSVCKRFLEGAGLQVELLQRT